MKLIINEDDLRKLINIPDIVQIEYIPNNRAPHSTDLLNKPDIHKCIREIDSLNHESTQRIIAIKKIREYTSYGLAEAKLAIECWDRWKALAISKNTLPTIDTIAITIT